MLQPKSHQYFGIYTTVIYPYFAKYLQQLDKTLQNIILSKNVSLK